MKEKRLIEDSLPLEAISRQSAREKSIRHGHISTLHIWWARRPLAAMRAAIFASLVPAPKDEDERAYLHDLIADIVDWDSVKNGNNKRVIEARDLIRKYHPDGPPKVLDPFMGGGSTGLEALRLGCEAHGVELNPVAYLIELCTLVYPQKYGQPKWVEVERESPLEGAGLEKQRVLIQNPLADDVRKWGKWVLEEARKEIGHLYEDPFGHTIVAYIWARTATCPNPACGAEMPMLRQTWLANKANKKVALRMLVDQAKKEINFEVVEGDAIDFDPTDMTMRRGTIKCPACGTTPDRDYLKTEGKAGRLGERMLAVVYTVAGQTGKRYRLSTEQDMAQFEEAREMLEKVLEEDPDALPTEPIPETMTGKIGVTLYGMNQWFKLFSPRQNAMLVALVRTVNRAYKTRLKSSENPDEVLAATTLLACSLGRMVERASTLSRWDGSKETLTGTFSRQAFPMVWDFGEVNPFSDSTGDWNSAIRWVVRVVEHCASVSCNAATLRQGDARRMHFVNGSMESIITDPPYYDAVSYADLSDYFYAWMKRAIGDLYPPQFSSPLSPKTAEIVELAGWDAVRYSQKNKQYYEENMQNAFAEAQRSLCDNGILVAVFAHKSTAAWETLIAGLLQAGLVVTASWPVVTEMANRVLAQDSAALASSIFIVCRKRVTDTAGQFDSVRRELLARVKERLDFFWEQGIRGADFFISAIGPAVEVFGKYSVVRKLTGDEVGVAELLDLVQESVADYTLSRVLNGRYQMGAVDAPTRFYVMYRWSYNKQRLDFDDGRRLAQALGAEVDGLIRVDKIVRQRGAKITVPDSSLRGDEERLGELNRDGDAAPLINLLHRSLLIWQRSGRQELADFLALHGQGREDAMHVVAQSIVSVLPDNDDEKRTLENYLQGSDALPDARQVGLGLEM